MTLYESLDDLLQAADDCNGNEDEEGHGGRALTKEELKKKHE